MTDMRITCGEDLRDVPIASNWHYWFYLVLPSGEAVMIIPELAEDSPEAALQGTNLLEPRLSEAKALLRDGVEKAYQGQVRHQECIEAARRSRCSNLFDIPFIGAIFAAAIGGGGE